MLALLALQTLPAIMSPASKQYKHESMISKVVSLLSHCETIYDLGGYGLLVLMNPTLELALS